MPVSEHKIDTIVAGGSAGSFTALKSILPGLPSDFPAALLICQHVPVTGGGHAADLLQPTCKLPLDLAKDGIRVEAGRAIFAVADTHMMLGRDHIHLRRGAHENNFRPAIDPLFRSAAVYRGPRAVGIILSGLLDDGAAGALALHRTGGKILVQSPETSEQDAMPRAAINAVPDAEVLPLDEIPDRLIELAGEPCDAPGEVPWQIGIELKISGLEGASMANEEKLGELSPYNCPHCNGVLWEIDDGPVTRFRCHTGHGYTIDSLGVAQEQALDQGLFDALRAHKGRASLIGRMLESSTGMTSRSILEKRAKQVEEDASRLEEIIKQRALG